MHIDELLGQSVPQWLELPSSHLDSLAHWVQMYGKPFAYFLTSWYFARRAVTWHTFCHLMHFSHWHNGWQRSWSERGWSGESISSSSSSLRPSLYRTWQKKTYNKAFSLTWYNITFLQVALSLVTETLRDTSVIGSYHNSQWLLS